MNWPFRSRRDGGIAAPGPRGPGTETRGSGAGAGELTPDDLVALVDNTVDPRLVVYHDPRSFQAEQYRSFRTNLRAMNPGDGARTILVTSALPEEGKSVTIANVALSLAEMDKLKVCLVDADLRAPSQHVLFGADLEPGLSDVLLDRLAPAMAMKPALFPNLTLIPAGRDIDNPGEVTGSDHLQAFLGYLKQRFQYILVDSPPCTVFSDAAAIARLVDGVVMVVAMEYTPRRDADRAMNSMVSAGGNVIGSFCTFVHTPNQADVQRDEA